MSVFKFFSSTNIFNCRNILNSRNAINSCEQQRVSISNKALEKLGIPKPPKKPLIPYFRFLKIVRPQIVQNEPNLNVIEVVKKVSAEWNKADPETKKKLQKEYFTEMESYLVEYEKYKNSITTEQAELIKSTREKKKRAKEQARIHQKRESLGRPKKPPTAFFRFVTSKKAEKDDSIKYSDWLKGLSKEWENLPEFEKEKFKREAEKDLEKYRSDVLTWEESMLRQGHIDVVRNKEFIDKSF